MFTLTPYQGRRSTPLPHSYGFRPAPELRLCKCLIKRDGTLDGRPECENSGGEDFDSPHRASVEYVHAAGGLRPESGVDGAVAQDSREHQVPAVRRPWLVRIGVLVEELEHRHLVRGRYEVDQLLDCAGRYVEERPAESTSRTSERRERYS